MSKTSLPPLPLPDGVESSLLDCSDSCGLIFHTLSAGKPRPNEKKPLVLLIHGFPELAFSWRKHLLPIALKGYHVVAPDQRGYGRTTGWDTRPYGECDLSQWTFTNLVRDMVCLTYALGYKQVHSIIGHDFGGVTSAMCPLIRPDVFQSCIQMSHPHHAPPTPRLGTDERSSGTAIDIVSDLAALDPPRKHYKYYNSTETAAKDWSTAPQGLHDFLRGYFHTKSADWAHNDPHPLSSWTAAEVAKMPEYYILPLHKTMPEVITQLMQGEDVKQTERWLSDDDLAVYVQEWQRTGFQGGLNWYRASTAQTDVHKKDLLLFAGRKIEVPTKFVSGSKDWGSYQQPGALHRYDESCTDFGGTVFVDGAGHWVQQEQPERVLEEILNFLDEVK